MSLEDVLINQTRLAHDDIHAIVKKVTACLSDEENTKLNESLEPVIDARHLNWKVENSLNLISVAEVQDIFKQVVWDGSEAWSRELNNFSFFMLAYMDSTEIIYFQELMVKIKQSELYTNTLT